MKPIMKKKGSSEAGFTLLECMIATVITVIGLVSVEMLIIHGIRMQTVVRDITAANALAKAKIEQLRNYPATASQRAPGGSVTGTPTTGYNDTTTDPRFRVRWLIEAAGGSVPAGTQRITVRVEAFRAGVQLPNVEVQVLLPTT